MHKISAKTIRSHLRGRVAAFARRDRGQVTMLYVIALPALLAVFALALDGGKIFVDRLHLQNAADAAALAAVQDVGPYLHGALGGEPQVQNDVNCYALDNHAPLGLCDRTTYPGIGPGPTGSGPAITACDTTPWDNLTPAQRRDSPTYTNCYQWPYYTIHDQSSDPYCTNDSPGIWKCYDKLEVRLRNTAGVSLNFGGLPGFPSNSHPWARSIATFNPELGPNITTTQTTTGSSTSLSVIDPTTQTTVINGTTTVITTVTPGATHTTTNVTFGDCPSGANDCGVAFAKSTACPAITYTGNGGTTIGSLETNGGFSATGNAPKHIKALFLGRYSGRQDACYVNKGVATFDQGPIGGFSPQDWPIPPPTPPTPVPLSQPALSGNQCWSITSVGEATKPGVYCSPGSLNFSGQILKGYTFFAQCISVSGNSGDTEYYKSIPGSEGARQQTLFDATGTDADCGGIAVVTIQGQSNILVGDIFAPNGKISMQGGGVQGGSGFLESQTMAFAGTFPNYTGTGPKQGGSLTTVTTTDPDTTNYSTTVIGGSTTVTTTPGTVLYSTTGFTTVVVTTVPGSTTSTTIGLGG
jgi:Putative Flp pilus-assembly TadE/G-like